MPNGMSDCFRLSKRELGERLASIMPTQEVGYTLLFDGSGKDKSQIPARRPADAARVLQMLEEFQPDDVFVEEQDGSYYVIHLDADGHIDGTKWVMVRDTSPLCGFLRERHHRAAGGGTR